jgi:hypothetical protein
MGEYIVQINKNAECSTGRGGRKEVEKAKLKRDLLRWARRRATIKKLASI